MRKSTVYLLIFILALGFAVRILGSGVSFFDDEPDWLVLVNSISFNTESIHLPLSGVGHGPLAIYLTKLSGVLFGETQLGYRLIIILFNVCLIWLMFLFTKQSFGEKAGLFAAFLTAINSFLIYYSREIGCDGYFLLFCLLGIYFFLKAAESKKNFDMLVFGAFMGMAILNKITVLFLVPGFTLYLLVNKERREWFRRPSLYLSMFICFILILPYVYWLSLHQWSHFDLNSGYIKYFNFPLSSLIFLGSILRSGTFPHVNSFGREYMSLGMGLLLLIGTILTINKIRKHHVLQLMQFIFWGIIGISVLFFRGWPVNYNLCIIPAIILTAFFLDSLWCKYKLAKPLILLFFAVHLCLIPQYLNKIDEAYHYHSSLSAFSRKIPQNVNLNVISAALIPLIDQYQPTLVVTPNPEWDTIACYLGAQTGVRTLAPVPLVYDSIGFNTGDWKRILIIDEDRDALSRYTNWAQSNNDYNVQAGQELLQFDINGGKVSLPVATVLLFANGAESFSKKTFEGIKIDNFIINSLKRDGPL